jgi:hypothetical protein
MCTLAHRDDIKAAIKCVELCREIENSAPLRPFVKREVMPGNLKGDALENFIRNAATTYWHQTCTAKMGYDEMSVVDGYLKVHDIGHLRIADGSIMPRITTGDTMAPCVVIGERRQRLSRSPTALEYPPWIEGTPIYRARQDATSPWGSAERCPGRVRTCHVLILMQIVRAQATALDRSTGRPSGEGAEALNRAAEAREVRLRYSIGTIRDIGSATV